MNLMDVFVKIGADTSDLESGVSKSEGIVSKLGSGLGSAMKVAGAAVAGATAAVGAFALSAVKVGASFDSAMSQVSATLGYTTDDIKNNVNGAGDAFKALRDKAEEAGRTTIFSATESAEGLNILAMSGYNAEESIAMLDDVLHLAAAGSMDMATAAGFVSGAVKGFADDTKDAQYYADLMAKGATLASTSVEELGDAISSGAAGAASYGQSAESMTVSLLRLAEQGEVGSAAGTALAAAMKDIYTGTDQAKTALKELGVDAYDPVTRKAKDFNQVVDELEASMEGMTDEEKNNYKQTIFGIQGLNAYNKMVVTGIEKQDQWADALSNAAGEAAKQYSTMTDNLEGDVAGWNSALDGFRVEISDKLTPSIREFVQFGTSGLSEITDAFKSGGLEGAMEAFGKVLSDGLNMIISKLPSFIDAGMKLLGALGQGLLDNLPMIINAAVQVADQLATGIAQAVPALLNGAEQLLIGLVNGIGKIAPSLLPKAAQMIVNMISDAIYNLPDLVKAALNLIQGLVDGLINAIPVLIKAVPQIIQGLINGLFQAVPMLINGTIKLVQGVVTSLPTIINSLIEAIPQVISLLINGLLNALPALIQGHVQLMIALVNALPQIIQVLVNAIPQVVNTIVTALVNNMPALINGAIQLVMGIVKAIPQIMSALIAAVPQIIGMLVSALLSSAPLLLSAVVQILAAVGSTLLSYGSNFVSNVGQTMSNILNTVVQWLSQLPEKMAYWAGYAIGSFIKFVAELPSRLVSIFNTVISRVTTFGTNFANKAREAAKQFYNNMVNNIASLPSKISGLANQLVSAVSSLPSKFTSIGKNIVDGLWNGIKGGWDWLKDKVAGLADSLFQGAKDALGIHSPSKKFAWIGQMIDEGLAGGIDKFSYLVDGSLGNLGVLDSVNTTPQLAMAGGYGSGDYNQTINIYSPTALTPSEVARQTRNATRDMVLELRGKR